APVARLVVAHAGRGTARDHAGLGDAATRGLLLRPCGAARGPAVTLRYRIAEPRAVAHAGPRRPDRGRAATLADSTAIGPGGGSGPRDGSGDQDGEDDGTTRSGDRHRSGERRVGEEGRS